MTGGACCTGGSGGDELSVFQLFRKINKAVTELILARLHPEGFLGGWGGGGVCMLVVKGGQQHLAFLLHFSSVLSLREILLKLSMSSLS